MKQQYFKSLPDDPPPLAATVQRLVRFEEVDPLGIVWHGHYASFFDDARVALGNRYGMGYLDFLDHAVVTPIRQLHVDHHNPLSYPERFTVEAILHYTDAARINYEFVVRRHNAEVVATGFSVQLMLNHERQVLIVAPPFLADIRDRWRRGCLQPVERTDQAPVRLVERFADGGPTGTPRR